MKAGSRRILKHSALLLCTFLLFVLLFYLSYRCDNKYTASGPQPKNGVLVLDEGALAQHPILWLVSDWEIFRGVLLTPDDFKQTQPQPDELVFIGQYGGLEGRTGTGLPVRSPHGSATYRLTILLPEQPRSYTLELPEIYSAYRLYVNGRLAKEMGKAATQDYLAETGVTSVTVQAAGELELLIAVSDYSHFYSGMVYPPAFGTSDAVKHMMNMRLVLRTLACALALCIGMLYLMVGLLRRMQRDNHSSERLPFFYAALCLAFAVSICYPVIKVLFWGETVLYRLETFAYCIMLLLVILIRDRLTGMLPAQTQMFTAFGVFVCACALTFPMLMGNSLNLMTAYSRLIGVYTLACAVYLTAGSVYSVFRGTSKGLIVLLGVAAFDAALVMDRVFPLFEPIRYGWFTEMAGGILVLCTGAAMTLEIASRLRLRQAVEARSERVAKMLEVQRAYHPVLLEKEQEAKAARHDLRHHITVLRELLEQGNLEGLRSYLALYSNKDIAAVPMSYCRHYVTDMLLRMYAGLASKQDTPFRVEAVLPEVLAADDVDLCVILSNLLENALEASVQIPASRRGVHVSIGCKHGRLIILVENRFDGQLKADNERFFSRKQRGRLGMGIASVRALAARCGGSVSFYAEEDIFYSEVFLPQRQGVPNQEAVKQ